MDSEATFSELNNLLLALQLFSITLLQKKQNANSKVFFHKVTDILFDLQNLAANPSNKSNDTRTKILSVLQDNENQNDEFKFDDKLKQLLNDFVKSKTKINIPTNLTPAEEINERMRLIEEHDVYLSAPQTNLTQQYDAKVEEILAQLNTHATYKQKHKYLRNSFNDLNTISHALQTNTETPLTDVQADEINRINTQLQELGSAYTRKVQDEQDEEVDLQNKIEKLAVSESMRDRLQAVTHINTLSQIAYNEGEYAAAMANLEQGLNLATNLEANEDAKTVLAQTHELLGHTNMQTHSFEPAKKHYKLAADFVNDPNKKQKLESHINKANIKIVEEIIKSDKDIHELDRMQTLLKTSGDVSLVAFVNKHLHTLYEKLVNPTIKPSVKTQLINKFSEDWSKYVAEKVNAATKSEWYTPEIEAIMETGLMNNLRTIRETFNAQAAQHVSAEDMIEAKEKALRSKAEAEKALAAARAQEEKMVQERAAQEEHRRLEAAREAEKVRIQAIAAEKVREEELHAVRNKIQRLAQEKSDNNLEKVLEQFQSIKSDDRTKADLEMFADTNIKLATKLRQENHLSDAQRHLQSALESYNSLLIQEDYKNVKTMQAKVNTLTELGRLNYAMKNDADAKAYFKEAAKESVYFSANSSLDKASKTALNQSEKINNVYALLMDKMGNQTDTIGHANPLLENLFHFEDLKSKAVQEENNLLQQLLQADKDLSAHSPRIDRLQEIISRVEHTPLKKNIILSAIVATEKKDPRSVLNERDKEILQAYHEAMINLAFAETLRQVEGVLPSEPISFADKIELIRSELRARNEATLLGLGLNLEQKIAYIGYESQRLRKESQDVAEQPTITKARLNLNALVNKYRRELINPTPATIKPAKKRKWSMGNMMSKLRRKRNKKPAASSAK